MEPTYKKAGNLIAMRNLTATLCLTVAVLLGSMGVSWSADFQNGLTAYKSGDYATALREWTPLAEQGDAYAQTWLGAICTQCYRSVRVSKFELRVYAS